MTVFNPFAWLTSKAEEAVSRGIAQACIKAVPPGEGPPATLADLYQALAEPAAIADKAATDETAKRGRK